MVVLFSTLIPKGIAPDITPQRVAEVAEISVAVRSQAEANLALLQFLPDLKTYAPHPGFLAAVGLLVEKLRLHEGMIEFWRDLVDLCPNEQVPYRLLMRWYRRGQKREEGLEFIHQRYPSKTIDLNEAEGAIDGLAELQEFTAIDDLMEGLDECLWQVRGLKLRYIKVLSQQMRYIEAAQLAASVTDREKLGAASVGLLDQVEKRAKTLRQFTNSTSDGVVAGLLRQLSKPEVASGNPYDIGKVVFFTGQLGTGGAERQMTRLAAEFKARIGKVCSGSGHRLITPPEVCVRHANPHTGADFFLPFLKKNGIDVTIMTEMAQPDLSDLELPPQIEQLLDVLPEDQLQATCKLVPYFQKTKPQVAYLWQDGGVYLASIAALIAGVPRVVTSFRGLPPNLRPELFRPQLPALYRGLASLPQVTFSANSSRSARSYEEWLGLPNNSVQTVHNATDTISGAGDAKDEDLWRHIIASSAECDKTVLGVFRFNANKRPRDWIAQAKELLKTRPNTRFVLMGGGDELATCKQIVADQGLGSRVFFTGVRKHVGFYLKRADLVMHLAIHEGLPNVLIEAQMAGKPVIATPAGGTDEVVAHNISGLVLSDALHLDTVELQAQLSALLNDEDRLQRMGAAAARLAAPKFHTDAIIAHTLELFQQLEEVQPALAS